MPSRGFTFMLGCRSLWNGHTPAQREPMRFSGTYWPTTATMSALSLTRRSTSWKLAEEDMGGKLPLRGSRGYVLGTRYSVLGTRYSVLGTPYSVLGTRYSVKHA